MNFYFILNNFSITQFIVHTHVLSLSRRIYKHVPSVDCILYYRFLKLW